MLHLLPHRYKHIYLFQMMVLLSFIIVGFSIVPFIILAYLLLFKTRRILYRAIVNRLSYFVWIHLTYVAQWWNGLRLRLYIDEESLKHIGKEHALIIMNHKYDIDWLTTWIFAERFGVLGGGQCFAKSSLKYLPIIGWIWQFNGAIFLNRNYEKDRQVISEGLRGFNETLDGYFHVLLIYPEGTRFTTKKLEASNEIARSKGMPELKHCLIPRSRGFIDTINGLRSQVDVIYNLTVGFPDSVDPSVTCVNTSQPRFTMLNVLNADVKEGDLACERILMKDLPESDEDLNSWLQDLFRKKDALFDRYVHTGRFDGPYSVIQPSYTGLIINCITFAIIWILLGSWLAHTFWVGTWVIRSAVIGTIVSSLLLIQLVMNVTKTEKGSSYGMKTK